MATTKKKYGWKGRENRNQGSFRPDPGTVKTARCGVCNSVMKVSRGEVGSRSYMGALAGRKSEHDHFQCPHLEESWHRQIRGLQKMASDTPSSLLANLAEDEIKYILKHKKPTKAWFDF